MRTRLAVFFAVFAVLLALAACGRGGSEQPASESSAAQPAGDTTAATGATGGGTAPASKPAAPAAPTRAAQAITVPLGTTLTVRLGQSIGSKISESGETFTANVATPVQINGRVVIPAGARAEGTVVEAAPLGRFKGGARLRVALNSLTVDGKNYQLQTSAVSHAIKGKGKRTATMIGGGAGAGALIGGLAGGGKGAAIGAAVGAGAGTAGAAFTGNKNITLPAESAVTFKLTQPLQIRM